MAKLNILIPTSWFPNPFEETKCIFNKNSIEQILKENPKVSINVISPIPIFYGLKIRKLKKIKKINIINSRYAIYYPRIIKLPLKFFPKIINKIYYNTYSRIIKKFKIEFDLIHVHGLNPDAKIAAKLAVNYKRKLIIHIHDSVIKFDKEIENALHNAEYLVPVSNFQKEQLSKSYPKINANKIIVIHNGIPNHFFKFNPSNKQSKIAKFVFVGRLHPIKGLDWLLENIEEAMGNIIYSFDLYGTGPQKKLLESIILNKKLNNIITLKGEIKNEDVPGILSTYNYFLSTTNYETFGIANVESLAVGIPLIVTKLKTLEEVFYDPSIVCFFKQHDIKSLNKAIKNAVNQTWDPKRLKSFAKDYSLSKNAEEILKLYFSINYN